MPMFRLRLPEVEARQLTVDNLEELEIWSGGQIKGTKLPRAERVIDIDTAVATQRANIGDWIVKGHGWVEVFTPDQFKARYVPA